MKKLLSTLMMSLVVTLSTMIGTAQISESVTKKVEQGTGVLLLAHGGNQNWNNEVKKIAAAVNQTVPVEVAFGMASKRNIQQAVDNLVSRGARRIVAVPLFVSPHSTVITSTEYLLGQRKDAPAALAAFAKMDHGDGGGHSGHHSSDTSLDPTTPVKSPVPIEMAQALGGHPLVADILLDRARDISSDPRKEVVVIVAHGPVTDEDNARWLADMRVIAENLRKKSDFKDVQYLTVRDDAPEPIRSRATAELRSVVTRAVEEKGNVLVVPLLLSYGGIEDGIKKRLDGLVYTMGKRALLPDDRFVDWVLLSTKKTNRTARN